MADEISCIESILSRGLDGLRIGKKPGQRQLQPLVQSLLSAEGYCVDREDSLGYLASGHPVWRDKETFQIVSTSKRRLIDLVIRRNDEVIALVETESDLNDLREHGVSRRSGHYDVFSIARDSIGSWFHSYKSLERMASAAFYAAGGSPAALERLTSNDASDHNPKSVGLFLVTGRSRAIDRKILAPRLSSLDARLISVIEK